MSLGAIIFSTLAFLCFAALLIVGLMELHEILIGIFALGGFFSGLAAVAMWLGSE